MVTPYKVGDVRVLGAIRMTASRKIEKAISELQAGNPVLIFDFGDREGETDLVYWGATINAASIRDLRLNAGAPVTVFVEADTASELGLVSVTDLVASLPADRYPVLQDGCKTASLTDCRF